MKTLITQVSPTIHPIDTTKMFCFIVQVECLKQLPQLCNNSSDLSHPQNCVLIESFHSQWPIMTTCRNPRLHNAHQQISTINLDDRQ